MEGCRHCVMKVNKEQSGMELVKLTHDQCPFTAKYVPILEEMAKSRNAAFQSIQIQKREKVVNAPRHLQLFPFSMTASL